LNCGTSLVPEPVPSQERKLVSVLFVDLVGFTARSDQADPEDVRETLEAYHALAKEQIERYGGVLEKFIGDAVMALFGAPVSHGDDAERAVRTGFGVLASLEELNRDRPGLDLAARAAVNTGEAVVVLGSRPDSGEALALGDVVNTAARLQTAAPPGCLIVGEETYRATRRAIRYKGLAAIEAKGKREPVPAWLALAPEGGLGRSVKIVLSGTLGLAGGLAKRAGKLLAGGLASAGTLVAQLVSGIASVPGLATLLDVARTAAGLSDAARTAAGLSDIQVGDVTLEDNAE